MVRFSIIMPAHDAEVTIETALASALAQTGPSLEVIVVDDASTDRTWEVISAAAARDDRVRPIRCPVNGGPGAARNCGLDAARGEWIGLLDADDAYLPGRLAHLLAIAEEKQVEIVADNKLLCPEDGSYDPIPMFSRERLPEAGLISAAAFVRGNVGGNRKDRVSYGFMQPIMRRDFLERNGIRYDPRNRFGEDYMLYVQCLVRGARWWYTPEPMHRYVIREGSLTKRQSAGDLDRIREMEAALLRDEPIVAADRALEHALRRHKSKIDRDYYYRAFTDAVKSRATVQALRLLFDKPAGFRHILQESAYQARTVLWKALRGGYRASKPRPRGRDTSYHSS